MLQEGELAPGFELPDENNHHVGLNSFRGHPLVLYFFPRADTPG